MLSSSIPILAYEGSASPAAGLDSRAKLFAGLTAAIGVLVATDVWQFLCIGALLVVAVIGSRIRLLTLWSNVRPVLLFLVIGGAVIAFQTRGAGWSFGFVHVSRSGLGLAGRLSAQLVVLLAITTVITYTTTPLAIANALRRLFGFLTLVKVPVEDLTTMLTLAITFIPLMSQEVDRYLTARAARGATTYRLGIWTMLGDLLVPLIQANLQRGEELALALDTRLYGYGKRTHLGDSSSLQAPSIILVILTVAWITATLLFL